MRFRIARARFLGLAVLAAVAWAAPTIGQGGGVPPQPGSRDDLSLPSPFDGREKFLLPDRAKGTLAVVRDGRGATVEGQRVFDRFHANLLTWWSKEGHREVVGAWTIWFSERFSPPFHGFSIAVEGSTGRQKSDSALILIRRRIPFEPERVAADAEVATIPFLLGPSRAPAPKKEERPPQSEILEK